MSGRRALGLATMALLTIALAIPAPVTRAADPDDFTDMSFEDLLDIEITSVSRKSQRLQDTAAAVHVITQEDIRRSGHTSIPELLRMVPGVNVARNKTNGWSISIRGFQETFSRMLLVMVDGRSVYTPLFAGTYWDIQDMALEDIDRIEIVRGPGASVWGSNAVNGVINIIRKKPEDTQGSYASVAMGTEDRLLSSFRHGMQLGDDLSLRLSGRYINRDESVNASGMDQPDEWRQGTTHMRADWLATDRDTVTLQGDWYGGDRGSAFRVDPDLTGLTPSFPADSGSVRGGNLMLKWHRQLSESASTDFQLYWDNRSRNELNGTENRNTYDLEFRNRFTFAEIHDVNWGVGSRIMRDRIDTNTLNVQIVPRSQDEAIHNAYVQDEIRVIDDLLMFALGSKFEWNTWTGWEPQPTARVMFTPHQKHQFWGSVSRAARIPSRAEREATLIFNVIPFGPIPIRINPDPDFETEYMTAHELGYRMQPTEKLSFDLTAFFNKYQNARSTIAIGPGPGDQTLSNTGEANAYGFELLAQWEVRDWWKLVSSWSHMNISGSLGEPANSSAPHHQLKLNSFVNLPWNLELDTGIYYTGKVREGLVPPRTISGYWRYDARLGWRPTPNLDVSLVWQNLFDDQQREFSDLLASLATGRTEIERNVYGKVTWRF